MACSAARSLAARACSRLTVTVLISDTERAAVVAQIQRLHAAVFGRDVAADGPEVEANLELMEALLAIDDSVPGAWAGLLTALLRDPDFLLY